MVTAGAQGHLQQLGTAGSLQAQLLSAWECCGIVEWERSGIVEGERSGIVEWECSGIVE